MLSPVGALPPMAQDPNPRAPERDVVALRYGYWRYDSNDDPHDNFGLSLTHRVGGSAMDVRVTGGYLSLQCGTCSGWIFGGLDLRSTLWHGRSIGSFQTLAWSVGLQGSAGAATYRGQERSSATSLATAAALNLGTPFFFRSRLSLSLLPGLGYGAFSSEDLTGRTIEQTVGAALAWTSVTGFGVNLGAERVVIPGSGPQIGAGITWRVH